MAATIKPGSRAAVKMGNDTRCQTPTSCDVDYCERCTHNASSDRALYGHLDIELDQAPNGIVPPQM